MFNKSRFDNDGFSLLELVVAVGILLVLVGLGLLAYSGFTAEARQAVVQQAASEIFNSATVRHTGVDEGEPTQADDEWMNSAGDGSQVKASVKDLGNGRYEVKAWYGAESYEASKHTAIKITPETQNPSNPDNGNETEKPDDEDVITPPCSDNPSVPTNDMTFLNDHNFAPELVNIEDTHCRMKAYTEELERRTELFVDHYNGVELGDIYTQEDSQTWFKGILVTGVGDFENDPEYDVIASYDSMLNFSEYDAESKNLKLNAIYLVAHTYDNSGAIVGEAVYIKFSSGVSVDQEAETRAILESMLSMPNLKDAEVVYL